MYNKCTRCQFMVKITHNFCQICGNTSFIKESNNLQQDDLRNQSYIVPAFDALKHLIRQLYLELKDTAIKLRRAGKQLSLLIIEPQEDKKKAGKDTDYVFIKVDPEEIDLEPETVDALVNAISIKYKSRSKSRRLKQKRLHQKQDQELHKLKQDLNELKNWFNSYGQDVLIIKQPSNSLRSNNSLNASSKIA